MLTSILRDMTPLPPLQKASNFQNAPQVEVSLIIPARNSTRALEQTVREADRFLSNRYSGSYEIILVPNPAPGDLNDASILLSEGLAAQFPCVRVHIHNYPPGKGAAIRTGFSHSRGKWIFLTDADLPYDLEFFDQARVHLENGYDLIAGNRRLPSSHFWIPVGLLPIAYGRHRLGMGFNRLVRLLLPIRTTDTQAGIKALSRRLAIDAFEKQSCPGFLYDLEIFLTAHGHGYRHKGIPVTLFLNTEKSTVRVLRECLLVSHWILRIQWRNKKGIYGTQNSKSTLPSRTLWGRYRQAKASLSTRLFLLARWYLTPYSKMTAFLPRAGKILDFGCGHGLFAWAAVLQGEDRQVFGLDHDPERVRLATQALSDFPQLQFKQGGLNDFNLIPDSYSGIAMIDFLHYFTPSTQEAILKQAYELLSPGGVLLAREVEPNSGLISHWNRLYERIATRIGFTQADEKDLHFRTRLEWCALLKKNRI